MRIATDLARRAERPLRRFGLACLLGTLPVGCNSVTDPGACTLIGCSSGLEIVLEDPPDLPYRIEAFDHSGETHHVFECTTVGKCAERVFLDDFTPEDAFIVVITDTGTERFEVAPAYSEFRPNGPRCGPLCRRAVVRLPSDHLDPAARSPTD